MKHLILIAIFLFSVGVQGQLPTVPKPTSIGSFGTTNTNKSYSTPTQKTNNQYNNSPEKRIQNQSNHTSNAAMGYSKPITPDDVKINNYKNPFDANTHKEQSEIDKIKVELEMLKIRDKRIHFEAKSFSELYPIKTKYYYDAFDELNQMVKGEIPIDIARAVFLVENAYNDNKGSYEEFNSTINGITQFCNDYMDKKGHDKSSNLAKNMMLFRFMSDTLEWNGGTHLPMTYDFEDYKGDKDWKKMFVTKLLKTNTGQCHSMPLLYLMLAQRIGADAYLSFSPSHSYIQFKEGNKFYNLELTNHFLSTDDWIFESGYIKTEAIRSGIYMDSLSLKQTIAYMMEDLANGYSIKFGSDKFVIETLNTSLKYYPNSIHGMLIKSNYYTGLFYNYMNTIKTKYQDKPSLEQLKAKYPIAFDTYMQRNAIYDVIDNMGYEPMPEAHYEAWLQSVNSEKNRREHDKQEKQLMNIIKLKID